MQKTIVTIVNQSVFETLISRSMELRYEQE